MDKQTRAELKSAYKQTPRPAGMFVIKNKINGKILLGSSLDLNGPLNRIKFELSVGSHRNKILQDDWNEFGEENFSFEILEQLESNDDPGHDYSDDLTALEELWLEELDPFGNKGYNDGMIKLRY